MFVINKKDRREVEVFEGVKRHTLACGKDVLMAMFEYKEGSKVPPHRHSYEQVTTMLEGEQKIFIRSEEGKTKLSSRRVIPISYQPILSMNNSL